VRGAAILMKWIIPEVVYEISSFAGVSASDAVSQPMSMSHSNGFSEFYN